MKESNEIFELCKQVYKATNWRLPIDERPVEYWVQHDDEWDLEYGVLGMPVDGGIVPLYTSDYLLEKLPEWTELKRKTITSYTAKRNALESYSFESDTPLKALLKLTLKLHEEEQL